MNEVSNREMIEQRCEREGFSIQKWAETDDGEAAVLGTFNVITDEYDDEGLYEGDTGLLTACVVGAEQYGNRRVHFEFVPEGCDAGPEVPDLTALDPVV